MLQYDFEQSIGCWLVRAWHAYERALNGELLPKGITFRQAQVLGMLAYEGDMTQVELADRMRVEPPTLVGILDRMERDGWISRHDCANDRRKKIIRATPQAEPVWAAIVDAALRVRARAVVGLSVDEIETFKRLLQRIETNVASDQPIKEHAGC